MPLDCVIMFIFAGHSALSVFFATCSCSWNLQWWTAGIGCPSRSS